MGTRGQLKRLLGGVYRSAAASWESLRRSALPLVAWSGLLSSLYYLVVSGAFRREHKAVAFGLVTYRRTTKKAGYSIYLLRRNIHRLEKGLIMKVRRRVFAVDHIGATVGAFARYVKDLPAGEIPEADWMWNVLDDYFNAAGDHRAIEEARRAFSAITYEPVHDSSRPFAAQALRGTPVSFEQFHALARQRKSIRWYLQQPVPRDVIDKAIGVAGLAPSACNRQPITFHVFDDPPAISRVAALAGGADGFSHNFPALVVVTGQLRAYFNEHDRHIIYIDGSLAAMSFMHALLTMGVASCVINWPDLPRRDRRIARLLALQPDERVVLLISFGYPDPEGLVPFSQKKDPHGLRSFNA